jgi:hypothetical protein
MKLDPGMHIGLHLVSFGKSGVTVYREIRKREMQNEWWTSEGWGYGDKSDSLWDLRPFFPPPAKTLSPWQHGASDPSGHPTISITDSIFLQASINAIHNRTVVFQSLSSTPPYLEGRTEVTIAAAPAVAPQPGCLLPQGTHP